MHLWGRFKGAVKRDTRHAAKTLVKVNRGITVGASLVAGAAAGPVAGEAVAAIGGVNGRFLRGVQARNDHDSANAAKLGRSEFKRTFLYGSIAGGVGSLVSAGATAVGGGSVSHVLAAGGGGQLGGQLLVGGPLTEASLVGMTNPLTGAAVEAGGALASANSSALAGSIPGAAMALPEGGTAAVTAAQAAAVASGAAPLGGGAALAAGGAGGGLLAGIGSALVSSIPTILKALAPAKSGGGVGGEGLAGGGGVGGSGGGGGDDGSGGPGTIAGGPNWLLWGGMAVLALVAFKAVKK